MRICGIIAEYNPFHNGHMHQLSYIKETLGADYVIAVMSGDFVQRGEPACIDKYARAASALRCGVDLVLELPAAASLASAEQFAASGVNLLNSLGIVTDLCFGCETPGPHLMLLADILAGEPPLFQAYLKEALAQGFSFPAARQKALYRFLPADASEAADALSLPNNILAIEYLKALKKSRSPIEAHPLLRAGDHYNARSVALNASAQRVNPSAAAIRTLMREDPAALQRFGGNLMPDSARSILEEYIREDRLFPEDSLDSLLFARLISSDMHTLMQYDGISESLANRILHLRNDFDGFGSFCARLKTKEITYSRISRALLCLLLDLRGISCVPSYARVLGVRKDSMSLLGLLASRSSVPLITRAAEAEKLLSPEDYIAFSDTVRVSCLYEWLVCRHAKKAFRHEYERPLLKI